MKTGAIIAAAGIPANMPDYDPTIMIGDTSVIKKIIITLQKSDVKPIVIVTGHKADILEKHAARMGVIFLRNEDFMQSDMFHTVRTGIKYLKVSANNFCYTVDIPSFSTTSLDLLRGGTARRLPGLSWRARPSDPAEK